MSWPQRPGAAPPPQDQRPPQVYNSQQNMYPNYQEAVPGAGNTQQQYWPAQQPQYTPQYNQVYQQQDYGNNANQFYQQQTQYNQNYSNQGYANTQQPQYQQNYYQNQGAQQTGYQNQPKVDGWEDNWDWGWDESAKQAQQGALPPATQATLPPPQQQQQQVFNNANVIEESFVSTDTWNWAMEDKKDIGEHAAPKPEPPKPDNITTPDKHTENVPATEPPPRSASNTSSHATSEEVKTLSDREAVKERLPNLALGKRFHLDNLTPQWSIESQMSQESSDGPQTHSEGTYRSDNQSRNSSKSSPGLNTENSNFNYSQSALDEYPPSNEWSRHSNEETTLTDNVDGGSRSESRDELTNSLQEMNITNRENPAPEPVACNQVAPGSVPPASLPPPASAVTPSQPSPAMPPPPPVTAAHPPPPSSSLPLPPTGFPQSSSSTNPFKQSGPFAHKKLPVGQPFPPPNLASPSVVSKVSQHRMPIGFGANLETTPDNSERPDQPPAAVFRPAPPAPPPDNLEVAPRHDRNEYLQTAHLSGGDYGEPPPPPPGLRRLVLGGQESSAAGDEPPPGLARMVPGQTEDEYSERHADGQTAERAARPYGQRTPDYGPRGTDRHPIGLDRMVPGEPSNEEFPQYPSTGYRGYLPPDAAPSDRREPNVDGSDYSRDEPAPAPSDQREVTVEGENLEDLSVVTAADVTYSREPTLDGADEGAAPADRNTDLSDTAERAPTAERRHSLNRTHTSGEDSERDRAFKASPRRDRDKHKTRDRDRERDKEGRYSRGERRGGRDKERERDRDWDRERRERDRERDESPHSRRYRRSTRSRRYETEDTDYYSDRERERRAYREGSYAGKPPRPDDKERRAERERERARRYNTIERDRARPDDRRRDRDRDERHHRDRDRYDARYRDIDPTRKHGNLEEERRRVTFSRDTRARTFTEGDVYSGASRPESAGGAEGARGARGAGGAGGATDEELADAAPDRRRDRDRDRDRDRRSRHPRADPYYDGYGSGAYTDPYELQRQQYQYYERLRATDPHAYLQVYKQLMAGRAPPPPPLAADPRAKLAYQQVYGVGYEARGEDRASLHSGRSSANGLKGNDTYYGAALRLEGGSLRDAPSLRTDFSDRELNTDASLNLHLEESTVRSDRMTPFKFSTAHVKGSIGSRDVVIVRPSYPVDGLPATVHVMSLAAALASEAQAQELAAYPGPLVKGVTHKKSVIEYCCARGRSGRSAAPRDVIGYVLVWELLALLLRQNGVVVGSDIAELLIKNKAEYEYNVTSAKNSAHHDSSSLRGSSLSGREREREMEREEERAWTPDRPASTTEPQPEDPAAGSEPAVEAEAQAALDRFRELLTYGNRLEALECAMSAGLWGHALALSLSLAGGAGSERRHRALVAQRFLAAQPAADPLHTLYAHLQAKTPPAATCVSEERWGDWRPHAAIILANPSPKPEHDRRTLTQLGDSLLSRGLLYSAQFCYVSGGVGFSRHPLAPLGGGVAAGVGVGSGAAPPRLALLLADSRASSLHQLATNTAIFATEIYEYALSLNQDYVIEELQVYKLLLATRLVDCGLYERALGYVEAASRAVTRNPRSYPPALPAALAELAERLRYHDPALTDDPPLLDDAPDSGEPSPRHQWLDDVRNVAHMLNAEASLQSTPQHLYNTQPATYEHSGWAEQAPQQYHQPYQEAGEEPPAPEYSQGYLQPPAPPPAQSAEPPAEQPSVQPGEQPGYEEWAGLHDNTHQYDTYNWQGDGLYSYNDGAGVGGGGGGGVGEAEAEARPQISMPGAVKPQRPLYHEYDDEPHNAHEQQERDTQTSQAAQTKKQEKTREENNKSGGGSGSGWLGGILTKLSLRPPNQMILPDDKEPTIVWDAENKRWVNKDADSEPPPAALPPPPTALPPTATHTQQQQQHQHPAPAHTPQSMNNGGSVSAAPPSVGPLPHPHPHPAPPLANIFKMQKSRHIKKSYVDVFNPSGAATRALPPAAEILGTGLPAAPEPSLHNNYFVPAPAPPHTAARHQSGGYDASPAGDDSAMQRRSGI